MEKSIYQTGFPNPRCAGDADNESLAYFGLKQPFFD
jgi:hypothetical protein